MNTLNDLLNDRQFQSEVEHNDIKYEAQKLILKKGVLHTYFYIIKEGKVKILIEEGNVGGPNIFLEPNDSLGEYALFDNLPASADAIADTEVELIQINIPSLRIFLEKHPEIGYKVCLEFLRKLIQRLRNSNKMLLNFYLPD